MDDKKNIFKCSDCGNRQLEFERHSIMNIDQYNRPLNMRIKTEIICASCKKAATVYKTDPHQAKLDELEREYTGRSAEFENKTIIMEEEDPKTRYKPIKFKGFL